MTGPAKTSVIRTPEHRLRVFVSSTLQELAEERAAIRDAILKLHLVPVMFEAGARPYPARELYQAYLSQSHVFLGVYWQSYGWIGPGMEISGLEDEFNLSARMPRLIYIKSPAQQRDAGLATLLARLQDENTTSYKHFSSTAELAELVENDLALLLTESFETAHIAAQTELSPRPLTNLPISRNPLLGRGQELETVCRWITQPDIGLVTLTGTGGTGKSRLALEAALLLRDSFADGVYLVRLAPVTRPERVMPAIAEALGLRESAQGGTLYDLLLEFLRERQTLLLLDNFEQVLDAAPQVADLLERCARVKVLVTSRAPLRIRGERELQLQPLPTPDQHSRTDLDRLTQYASVALFIQRAQAVRPDFGVTNENAPAVAEICHRLDGLPLAIELAAARIRLLNPQDLLARLGHRFDLLRGGGRDLPERHQTLRGAIDWSYQLLAEPARVLFRRLAVFSGGWSIEAAQDVCALDDENGLGLLDELEALVDFSLLTRAEGVQGEPRFSMLETIREYALERLVEAGEADLIYSRHARYLLRFVAEVEPKIRTSDRARWRTVMEQDLDNVRAAIHRALPGGDPQHTAKALMITLSYFWLQCGHRSEALSYAQLLPMAEADSTVPIPMQASLKWGAGGLAIHMGQNEAALPILMEGVDLARQVGATQVLGTCLLWAGSCALTLRNLPLASDLLQESLTVFNDIQDEWSEVLALFWLSNLAALQGDAARRQELFKRCLEQAETQGDPWLLVAPLADLTQAAFMRGDLSTAEQSLHRLQSALQVVDSPWLLAWVLSGLGQVSLARGELDAARAYCLDGLAMGRENGNRIVMALSLAQAALLITLSLEALEPIERAAAMHMAARLCGAAKPFVDHPLLSGGPGTKELLAGMIARVSARVDPGIWEPAFEDGAAAPLDQMLALAAETLSPRERGAAPVQ